MPNYSLEGKHLTPMSALKFRSLMESGKFVKVPEHKALIAVLYYFGFRISEALSLRKANFTLEDKRLFVTVQRLKHSKNTPALSVLTDRPYVNHIIETLSRTREKERVFPYCRATGWLIVRRALKSYPHYLRLNRITNLFTPTRERPSGYSIGEVRAFTGLTLNSLNYYVGLVTLRELGGDLR